MSNTVREDIHADNSVLHEANSSFVEGSGNEIYGDYCKINGDGNLIEGDNNRVTGDGNIIRGGWNHVIGNDELIIGHAPGDRSTSIYWKKNYITGDNITLENGTKNVIHGDNFHIDGWYNQGTTKNGGSVTVSGVDNFLFIHGDNDIDLTGSCGTEMFVNSENGNSNVVGFISGDIIHLNDKQVYSLSNDASGTTLHIVENGNHYNLSFADTATDIVKSAIKGLGRS